MKSIRITPTLAALTLGVTSAHAATIVFNPNQTTGNVNTSSERGYSGG